MTTNKSIDGLATRDAKKSAVPKPKKVKKTLSIEVKETPVDDKPVETKAKKTEETSGIIPEGALEIEVLPDDMPSKKISKTPENTVDKKENFLSREAAIEDFLSPIGALDLENENTKIEEEPTRRKSRKAKKPKKKAGKMRRIITTVLLVIILLILGVAAWAVLWGNDIIAKITGGQGNVLDLFTFAEEKYDPLKTDSNGRTNILAFGTSGYNMDGEEGTGVHDGAQLTDSIMAISLNQETGDIAMISLPRDLKASPTCTATGKINEIYWCNNMDGTNENAGATALMTEVGGILGTDFQYFAHLNWGSLVSIVDILGGIKVTLDEDILDYYWTGAVYEAGIEYTLDGEQALGLARARHGTSGGDFSRGASQQKILIGIKDAIFEKQLSLTDIVGLASTLGDNLRTNLSVSEIKTAAHLTANFDFNNMRQISLYPDYMTTGTINGISYVIPSAGVANYGTIQDYVATALSNDPRVYEEPTILVLNATEEVGVAGAERDKLLEEGYVNVTADNAPTGEYAEGYTLYALTDEKPSTKSLLETAYNTTALSNLPESLPTDYDFIIILNASLADN